MNKKRNLTTLGLLTIIILLLNFISSFVFYRLDLTTEKRYTLSKATINLLEKLDDVVYVKVYLEGSFPAGFKQLRNQTKEMLDEFRIYAHDNIEYEFIDPSEKVDKTQQKKIYESLSKRGLQPINLEVKQETGTSQQLIWPGAIVSYRGRELPWQLLKTQIGRSSEMQLNNSIQALEYEFASCIKSLIRIKKPIVAFVNYNRQLDTLSLADLKKELSNFYITKTISINGNSHALDSVKTLIIDKPDTTFSEQDKLVIDQFVMKGGSVLWAIDALNTNIDTLIAKSWTLATPYNLNIEDLLFKYGVRINNDMLVDMQSSAIPVNKATPGQEPRFELMQWVFFPLLTPANNHPISKNIDVVKVEYASTIDTIGTKNINKTVLLRSSQFSKILPSPVRIYLQMVLQQPNEAMFTDSYKPVAVLLEGSFESAYKNRVLPKLNNYKPGDFKEKSVPGKMIVIADGDILRNEIKFSNHTPEPLGYDKYTNQTYGNKNFILNCINYLCDDSGLMQVRAKELTLRLLDKKKVKEERFKWQMVNTVLPLLLIILFAIVQYIIRKRKYTGE
ncbi:MAG: gliding motility-associated ABC transporter substrate-binding protein GldG [Bacteroidia bacterium]